MVQRSIAHCCTRCRLLQQPAAQCATCGDAPPRDLRETSHFVAPPSLGVDVQKRDTRQLAWWQKWLGISVPVSLELAAFAWLVANHPDVFDSASIVVVLVAVGVAMLIGMIPVIRLLRRPAVFMAAVPVPALARTDGAEPSVHGVARVFQRQIERFLEPSATCLVSWLAAYRKHARKIAIRAVRSADFVVETDAGPVLIAGPLWLRGPIAGRTRLTRALAKQLGVPKTMRVSDDLVEVALTAGMCVRVYGDVATERVAALAGYRDGGEMSVMRGAPGRPVLIEIEES